MACWGEGFYVGGMDCERAGDAGETRLGVVGGVQHSSCKNLLFLKMTFPRHLDGKPSRIRSVGKSEEMALLPTLLAKEPMRWVNLDVKSGCIKRMTHDFATVRTTLS